MASGSLPALWRYDNTHKYQIVWSSTPNQATNTSSVTVKFMLDFTSRYGMYAVARNECYITFNGTKYSFPSAYWESPSSGTHTLYSRTFTVPHNSDGSGSFTLGGAHKINSAVDKKIWAAQTFALDKITVTSACSAPTSVTIAASRVGRGKTTTISWSGAKAGTQNAITGYRIYYANGSQPTTSSSYITVTTSSTSGSYTTTTSFSNTQGRVWYFKVRTLGAAGSSYWSGLSSTSTTLIINTTPTISSFSVNTPTVSSTGSKNVTFSFLTADANGDTVTKRVYYTNSSGSLVQIASTTGNSVSVTLNTTQLPVNSSTNGTDASHTFTCRVYDAYDGVGGSYYNSRTLKITRKAKPRVTSINLSAGNTEYYRNIGDSAQRPFCTQVTTSINGYYGTISSRRWYIRVSNTTSFTSATQTIISNNASLSKFNILSYVSQGQYYQIGHSIYNGYEHSDIYWRTSSYTVGGTTANYFYVAPAVNLIAISNEQSTFDSFNPTLNSRPQANTGDFSTRLSLSHSYNSLYTVRYYYSLNSNLSNPVSIGSSTTGAYGTNLTLNLAVTQRTPVYFFCRTYDGVRTSSNSSSLSLIKIITNPLASVVFKDGISPNLERGGDIKPIYTDRDSVFTASFTKFWGDGDLEADYNMNPMFWDVNVDLCIANQTHRVFQGDLSPTVVGDTVYFDFTGKQLYNWDSNPLNLMFNTFYESYLQIQMYDYFGNTYTVNSRPYRFYLDTREKPRFEAEDKLVLSYDKTGGTNYTTLLPDSSFIINEGYSLKFTCPKAITYDDELLIYQLQVARSESSTTPTSGYATHNSTTPVGLDEVDFLSTAPSVLLSRYLHFRVLVTDTLGQQTTLYWDGGVLRSGRLQEISASDYEISSGSVTEEASQTIIDLSYKLSDFGTGVIDEQQPYFNIDNGNGQVLVQAEYSTDNETFFVYDEDLADLRTHTDMDVFLGQNQLTELYLDKIENPFIYIRLKISVTTNATNGANLKTTYTDLLIIPNTQPTVAYREGHVGINNRVFEEDDVLVITTGPGSRDKVRLVSAEHNITFNITEGTVTGLRIGGGTWD